MLPLLAKAQIDTNYTELSWKDKNFFSQWGMSGGIAGEILNSPKSQITTVNSDGMSYTHEEESLTLTYVSFTYEPRINLLHVRDFFSVSLNTPVTAALSITTNDETGVFHLVLPAIVHMNFFYHSTYNNINNRGFTVGVGGQYIMAPVINQMDGAANFYPQVVAKLGYKYYKKVRGTSFDFTFGFLNGTSYKFTVGKILNY